MTKWPPIGEAELLARLAMPDEEFIPLAMGWAQAVGPREFREELYERALEYPWARPAESFLLSGEEVQPFADVPPDLRDVAAGRADGSPERYPLLGFGSNGSPETLARKFGGLSGDDRRVLVVAGDLHDFDVGAAAAPTFYGSLPGTIFTSPGTAVRASVLWVTEAQLVALTWSEVSYRLGRLEGVRFEPDDADAPPVEGVLAFVSRWGAHCVDGQVVAMQAIPASNRVAPALTQQELLDDIARIAFGETATARELIQRVMADFGAVANTMVPALHETARPFQCDRWAPFPAAPAPG